MVGVPYTRERNEFLCGRKREGEKERKKERKKERRDDVSV